MALLSKDRPDWINAPKSSDGVYCYRLGQTSARSSEAIAREAALRDAKARMSRDLGKTESDTSFEIVPGSIYVEHTPAGWSCWVQTMAPNTVTVVNRTSVTNQKALGMTQLPKEPSNLQSADLDLGQGVILSMIYISDLKLWVGKCEITIDQYKLFLSETLYEGQKDADGNYLKHIKGKDDTPTRDGFPIVWVSWNNAARFCQWLSEKTGASFRLPTEDEWMQVARAGKNAVFAWGDDASLVSEYAWFSGNTGSLQAVGKKKPNAYGLYDVAGNAWEFCSGWFDKFQTSRPLRGGSWFSDMRDLRLDARRSYNPNWTWNNIGFRVVGSPR